MKTVLYCTCAALLAAVVASCGVDTGGLDTGRAEALKTCEKLSGLDPAKAAEDARRAKSSGDVRLLGVHGYGDEVPGVAGDAGAIARTHGVRMIEGTSDAVVSKRCSALNINAHKYAAKYNKVILQ